MRALARRLTGNCSLTLFVVCIGIGFHSTCSPHSAALFVRPLTLSLSLSHSHVRSLSHGWPNNTVASLRWTLVLGERSRVRIRVCLCRKSVPLTFTITFTPAFTNTFIKRRTHLPAKMSKFLDLGLGISIINWYYSLSYFLMWCVALRLTTDDGKISCIE